MRQMIQKTNRIILLIVLWLCLCIKVHAAYTVIRFNLKDLAQITPTQTHMMEMLKSPQESPTRTLILPEDEETLNPKMVYSVNTVMIWRSPEGKCGHYLLSRDDVYNLQVLALNLPKEAYEEVVKRGRQSNKDLFMSIVKNRIARLKGEYTEDILYASNK